MTLKYVKTFWYKYSYYVKFDFLHLIVELLLDAGVLSIKFYIKKRQLLQNARHSGILRLKSALLVHTLNCTFEMTVEELGQFFVML